MLSSQILDALASKQHVPAILQGLEEQQDLSTIARSIGSPTALRCRKDPKLNTSEETKVTEDAKAIDASFRGVKDNNVYPDHAYTRQCVALERRKETGWSTTVLLDSPLTRHLISLYWVWIHPAHPILDMPLFLEHYNTGMTKYCSVFLVYAVCAAACDVLDPCWEDIPGKATNIPALRRSLVAEAEIQKALADPDAKTTAQAQAIMSVVDDRSKEIV